MKLTSTHLSTVTREQTKSSITLIKCNTIRIYQILAYEKTFPEYKPAMNAHTLLRACGYKPSRRSRSGPKASFKP